jgi:hypothetical protein
LKEIAREIADKVRANATIDWTIRESARAKTDGNCKRTLNKYGYPPDKQEKQLTNSFKTSRTISRHFGKMKKPTQQSHTFASRIPLRRDKRVCLPSPRRISKYFFQRFKKN